MYLSLHIIKGHFHVAPNTFLIVTSSPLLLGMQLHDFLFVSHLLSRGELGVVGR